MFPSILVRMWFFGPLSTVEIHAGFSLGLRVSLRLRVSTAPRHFLSWSYEKPCRWDPCQGLSEVYSISGHKLGSLGRRAERTATSRMDIELSVYILCIHISMYTRTYTGVFSHVIMVRLKAPIRGPRSLWIAGSIDSGGSDFGGPPGNEGLAGILWEGLRNFSYTGIPRIVSGRHLIKPRFGSLVQL